MEKYTTIQIQLVYKNILTIYQLFYYTPFVVDSGFYA